MSRSSPLGSSGGALLEPSTNCTGCAGEEGGIHGLTIQSDVPVITPPSTSAETVASANRWADEESAGCARTAISGRCVVVGSRSSLSASPASRSRHFTSFWRDRCSRSRRLPGVSRGNASHSGSRSTTAASVSVIVGRANGARPVSIS